MRYLVTLFFVISYQISQPVLSLDASHDHDVAEYLKVDGTIDIKQSDAHDLVSSVDWSQATRIEVLFGDDYYEPDELVLDSGKPYILEVKNVGDKRHDLSGEIFFSNIVTRQIKHTDLTVSAYHLESIFVQAGGEIEIWLVPKVAGEFPFICSTPGHMHEGMEGLLIVE